MRRHRLGQHYLVDRQVIQRVVSLAEIEPKERVLEIGTGKGALTRELVRFGASYVGYEVDRRNFEETTKAVRGTGAQVLLADAFEQTPEFDVLVSSLPYSESATFVRWLGTLRFNRAVVLLQEDFVGKITSPPGSRDYRGVSALSQICYEVRVLGKVGRAAFSPQPRVGSVIVSFEPKHQITKEEALNITRLFSLRRRLADSALSELGMRQDAGFGQRRVYTLRPEEVHSVCLPRPQ
jgi:16S rRNA (adenine1518-N6/adenine1519-N6)-dimethyltransferase